MLLLRAYGPLVGAGRMLLPLPVVYAEGLIFLGREKD